MITELSKQQVTEKLKEYCDRYESQNKAAKSLNGVSSATISQALNSNWELISDEMWRNIGSQIGYSENEWVAVEIRDFKRLNGLLADSQNFGNVFAVTGEAGSGKSFALRQFANENKRVYLLQCYEYWNRKMFLQELLSSLGRDYSGYTVGEMMTEAVRVLKTQHCPLIIMDEADKLSDQVLYFFITLYNQLEDRAGIVLCATDHLAKRIRRGLKLNKKGYKEIYSRIGRKFIELSGPGSSDIASICLANGITEKSKIKDIIEKSEFDLRRVKRLIHAQKQIDKQAAV